MKNINIFIGNNSYIVKSCRNCLNVFIVKKNMNFILNIVKTENLKNYYLVLKNMFFENLKNCIKTNWIIQSYFECIINAKTKEHDSISGGFYIECKNSKYSKNIQTFYNLEEYTKLCIMN